MPRWLAGPRLSGELAAKAGNQAVQLAAVLFREKLVGETLLEALQAGCEVFGGNAGCVILRGVHSDLQVCVGRSRGGWAPSPGSMVTC